MRSLLVVALMLWAVIGLAQDRPPAPFDVVAENEVVQVLRISIPPHARTPMHDVTPRVVIWLGDAHFVDRFADGTTREERRKAGDAEWVSARRHAGENLSDKSMDFIAVIVKPPGAGARRGPERP
jgi:hypothetical protein